MLTFSRTTRVFLATEPTDMRKGFDGLFALVENVIREDPFSGHSFVFRNQRRDRLKVLWWDRDGLAIFYKRLERGTYQFPTDAVVQKSNGSVSHPDLTKRYEIRADELALLLLLLEGIDLRSVKRRPRYERPKAAQTKAPVSSL
jgi:transposase